VEGFLEHFEVAVVAPRDEQSWVSRGMTRRGKVSIEPSSLFNCCAYAIGGTPSDCVNIGLGHLVERTPDIVASGINIGYNATETLVFSSGTVAGALEAAVWRLPALAASKWLPREDFEAFRRGESGSKELLESVACDGKRVARKALDLLGTHSEELLVHNLNFPYNSSMETDCVAVRPARLSLGSLFERKPEGHFEFTYAKGKILDGDEDTDYSVLMSGKITHSLLNFSAVGSAPNKN
jgi:5'-nucleotidase